MRALPVAFALLTACTNQATEETAPVNVEPRHATHATIPDGPVRGTIAGTEFEATHAYYRIYRQLGREHLDVMFVSEGSCEAITSSSVWIRFSDADEPSHGELRRTPNDDAAWSIQYQLKQNGRWLGHAKAAALVVIDKVKRGSFIEGDVSACFADASRSCVAGHFHATRCLDPLSPDVRDLSPE